MKLDSDEYDKSLSRSLLVTLWCCRAVIAVQCIGLAGRYLFSSNETESDVFGFLFFDVGWSEHLAQLIDDAGTYGCLVSAGVVVFAGLSTTRISGERRAGWIGAGGSYLQYAALSFIGVWFLLLAAAHRARGETYSEYAIYEQAVRFATPLAMLLLLRSITISSIWPARISAIILTIAVVATFIAHGYLAQRLHGPFVDLILLTDMRLFHWGLEQSTAETALSIIGWADIIVGVLLLLTRSRMILIYMIIWGMITAASRMTALGSVAWPETLIRVANGGAPLVLLMLYQNIKIETGRLQAQRAQA